MKLTCCPKGIKQLELIHGEWFVIKDGIIEEGPLPLCPFCKAKLPHNESLPLSRS